MRKHRGTLLLRLRSCQQPGASSVGDPAKHPPGAAASMRVVFGKRRCEILCTGSWTAVDNLPSPHPGPKTWKLRATSASAVRSKEPEHTQKIEGETKGLARSAALERSNVSLLHVRNTSVCFEVHSKELPSPAIH